ncbi:hypothetical protein Q5752_001154 [Cryptotrichosporon argae]
MQSRTPPEYRDLSRDERSQIPAWAVHAFGFFRDWPNRIAPLADFVEVNETQLRPEMIDAVIVYLIKKRCCRMYTHRASGETWIGAVDGVELNPSPDDSDMDD